MDVNQIVLLSLRVFHSVAALVWVGGGIYYLVAVRPQEGDEFARHAQRRFREWARPATLVMIATGVVLIFDGLSSNTAGLTYVATLTVKVGVALTAFWFVSWRRRGDRSSRAQLAVSLGTGAFVLGVVISSLWPSN